MDGAVALDRSQPIFLFRTSVKSLVHKWARDPVAPGKVTPTSWKVNVEKL